MVLQSCKEFLCYEFSAAILIDAKAKLEPTFSYIRDAKFASIVRRIETQAPSTSEEVEKKLFKGEETEKMNLNQVAVRRDLFNTVSQCS